MSWKSNVCVCVCVCVYGCSHDKRMWWVSLAQGRGCSFRESYHATNRSV